MTEQLACGSTSVERAAPSELIDLARYPMLDGTEPNVRQLDMDIRAEELLAAADSEH